MTLSQAKAQHVVAIPYPAQGHISPMLQLCQQLVPHGFTFTFVNTHHIHQRVQLANNLDAHIHDAEHVNGRANHAEDIHALHPHQGKDTDPVNHGKDAHANYGAPRDNDQIMQLRPHQHEECPAIRMVFVEGGCAPEQHAHKSTVMDALLAAQEMKEQVEQLLPIIMEENSVAFILTDIFLGWSSATANKFGLPWVCFWAASAATCAAFMHFGDLAEQGKHIPIPENRDGEVPVIEDIPGLPPTLLHDLPRAWDDTGKLTPEFLKYFNAAEKARFLLFNTFEELEGPVLEALTKRYSPLAVGPLLPARYFSTREDDVHRRRAEAGAEVARPSLFKEDRTCLDWLDTQLPSTVLFISFGSISARTEEQLDELAHAVNASGCPYVWVRRPDISADSTPLGAAAQHAGNGLIVTWAPQLDVLSHPAVGGFITHCGWNSVVESVAMGVPMLCWADMGERMSNQRFVVHIWKCGLDMVSDSRRRHAQHIDEAVLVRREELESSIRRLMLEEAGAPIRARAAHFRNSAILAFHDTHSHLDHLVQALHEKGINSPQQSQVSSRGPIN